MNWNKVTVWALALVASLCFVVMPAHAGIIITEGKVASEGKSPDNKTSSGRRGTGSSTKATTDEDCDELDENGFCIQTDETVEDVDFDDLEDLDGDPPEGWTCSDVGGGLQYCEPATGASPGAGAGGGLGVDGSMNGDTAPMGGCQGGPGAPAWPACLALLVLVGVLRRRQHA